MHCVYCMPPGPLAQPQANLLSTEEIARLLRAFAENGVTKVRFTGGEPLLRDDIFDLIGHALRTPGIRTIALTTNGRHLRDAAQDLKRAGLQRVNISLDSLDSFTFKNITGCSALESVLSGIDAALCCGFDKVKTNTVVMRGINDSEIRKIACLTIDMPLEVRFIELMPLGRLGEEWQRHYVSSDEILDAIGDCQPFQSNADASARLYKIPGAIGNIGLISPVSHHFCDSCNRIRVTASGLLKPCLRTSAAFDIRPLLHCPDLSKHIKEALESLKNKKLNAQSAVVDPVSAEAMCAIGG